jgi:hypothetical protein
VGKWQREALTFSRLPDALSKPLGEFVFVQIACRQIEEYRQHFGVGRTDAVPILCQKEQADDQCGALVSVNERMIARNSEGVTRSERRRIRLTISS